MVVMNFVAKIVGSVAVNIILLLLVPNIFHGLIFTEILNILFKIFQWQTEKELTDHIRLEKIYNKEK
jgi:hypothetical protein